MARKRELRFYSGSTPLLFFINEVELTIYRFVASATKNGKSQPLPVDLGVDQLTSR